MIDYILLAFGILSVITYITITLMYNFRKKEVSQSKQEIYRRIIAAKQGNTNEQYYLGECYYKGAGLKKNKKRAIKWFKLAANQGSADAQTFLGIIYYNKLVWIRKFHITPKKIILRAAHHWLKLASDQGNAEAQAVLGALYRYNYYDSKKAVKLFKSAASQGDSFAQRQLGMCYQTGYGVEIDMNEAKKWFKLAADQGDSWSQNKLEELEKETEVV